LFVVQRLHGDRFALDAKGGTYRGGVREASPRTVWIHVGVQEDVSGTGNGDTPDPARRFGWRRPYHDRTITTDVRECDRQHRRLLMAGEDRFRHGDPLAKGQQIAWGERGECAPRLDPATVQSARMVSAHPRNGGEMVVRGASCRAGIRPRARATCRHDPRVRRPVATSPTGNGNKGGQCIRIEHPIESDCFGDYLQVSITKASVKRRHVCRWNGDPTTIAEVHMHRPRFRPDEYPKLRRVLRELHNGAGVDVPAQLGVCNLVRVVAQVRCTGNAFEDICIPKPRAVEQDTLNDDVGAGAHQRKGLRCSLLDRIKACARFGASDLNDSPARRTRVIHPVDLKGAASLRKSVEYRILNFRPFEMSTRRLSRKNRAVRTPKE
jgi:hypothetical protein